MVDFLSCLLGIKMVDFRFGLLNLLMVDFPSCLLSLRMVDLLPLSQVGGLFFFLLTHTHTHKHTSFGCGFFNGRMLICFPCLHCDCLLQTQPMAELADVVHRVQAVTFPMQSAIPAPASVNVRTDLSERRGIFLVVSTIPLQDR